jgi:hypothetical protein
MNEPTFQFDELGEWSILKLDIIEQYGGAYTKAFGGRGQRLKNSTLMDSAAPGCIS